MRLKVAGPSFSLLFSDLESILAFFPEPVVSTYNNFTTARPSLLTACPSVRTEHQPVPVKHRGKLVIAVSAEGGLADAVRRLLGRDNALRQD
ncbi:MAG: hypothetical protein ACOXZQ_11305 [Bacteroidales bacterium]